VLAPNIVKLWEDLADLVIEEDQQCLPVLPIDQGQELMAFSLIHLLRVSAIISKPYVCAP